MVTIHESSRNPQRSQEIPSNRILNFEKLIWLEGARYILIINQKIPNKTCLGLLAQPVKIETYAH